jgi:exodeoxyribonuclease-3
MPIKVSGQIEFYLLAIWAKNDLKDVAKRYIGQVWLAINYYKELLNKPIIIIGDFNWNTIWDNNASYPLYGNLSDVINFFESKNIRSTYHCFYGEKFGKETKHTLFMHHKQSKPYHIDYCFASSNFDLQNVEIGTYSDWIKISDHTPIIISFNDKENKKH